MPATEEAQHDPSSGARPRANILVVDDDVSMRELLELHLSNAGYNVALADDAIAAGRMFLASTPDLLLIDVGMPYLNGLDFVATVFADLTVPIIPVIFITAYEHFAQHAEEMGAECLIKPVQVGRLLETVARNLKERRPAEPVEGAKPQPSAAAVL
jgi:DNA-binding response OmpR family regulator